MKTILNDAIPIIGQRFEIEGWYLQILLRCRCDKPMTFLVTSSPSGHGVMPGQCPSCKQMYVLQGFNMNPQTGQPVFQVGMATPAGAPVPTPDDAPKPELAS